MRWVSQGLYPSYGLYGGEAVAGRMGERKGRALARPFVFPMDTQVIPDLVGDRRPGMTR
jgi:hypothetical protein